jgi:hypothetical protein
MRCLSFFINKEIIGETIMCLKCLTVATSLDRIILSFRKPFLSFYLQWVLWPYLTLWHWQFILSSKALSWQKIKHNLFFTCFLTSESRNELIQLLSQYSLQMFIFQLVEVCHQYNKHKTDIIKICDALFVIFHQ